MLMLSRLVQHQQEGDRWERVDVQFSDSILDLALQANPIRALEVVDFSAEFAHRAAVPSK